MSSKISALPAAVSFAAANFFPMVDAVPDNFKCSRDVFLTASGGDWLVIRGYGTQFYLDNLGAIAFLMPAGIPWGVNQPVGGLIGLDNAGNLLLSAVNGSYAQISANSGSVTISGLGIITITSSPGNNTVMTYIPVAPPNWAPPPLDLITAVDRLAQVIVGLTGVPIP